MTDVARLEASLRDHEDERETLYICPANKLSIGVGRNLEDRPFSGRELRDLFDAGEIEIRLTPAGITRILKADVSLHDRLCRAIVHGWEHVDEVRQTVLSEMCFQLGPQRFAGFKRMLAAIEVQDWKQAAAEGRNSKWCRHDSPKRAEKLMKILESGEWPK